MSCVFKLGTSMKLSRVCSWICTSPQCLRWELTFHNPLGCVAGDQILFYYYTTGKFKHENHHVSSCSVSNGWTMPSSTSWGGKAFDMPVSSSVTTTFTSSQGTSSTSSRRCLQSAAWPGTSASNSTIQRRRTRRRSSGQMISAPPQVESLFHPLPGLTPP